MSGAVQTAAVIVLVAGPFLCGVMAGIAIKSVPAKPTQIVGRDPMLDFGHAVYGQVLRVRNFRKWVGDDSETSLAAWTKITIDDAERYRITVSEEA